MKIITYKDLSYFMVQFNVNVDMKLLNNITNNNATPDQYADKIIEISVTTDINLMPHSFDKNKKWIELSIIDFNLSKTILIDKDMKSAILNMNHPIRDIEFVSKLLVFSKGNYEVVER